MKNILIKNRMGKGLIACLIVIGLSAILLSSCDESGMNDLPQLPPELVEFKVINPETRGVIDKENNTVQLVVPMYADINELIPDIHVSFGSEVSPATGVPQDFSSPVTYTITNAGQSKSYTVTVELGAMDTQSTRLLVLGTADGFNEIANNDEKAAATWAINTFTQGTYVSFAQLAANPSVLNEIDVVWWHYDTSFELPEGDFALPNISARTEVLQALMDFRNNGGSIYLSGFAALYLEDLEVVESGYGPNEVGGAPVEFENADNWGISFKGRTQHPVFQDLRKFEEDALYLISGGAWRRDNKAWWAVWMPEFDFPSNGIDLASVEWDKDREVLVVMGEFQGSEEQGKVIAFSAGAYDWYSGQGQNTYMDNVQNLTKNILLYLATQD